MFHEERNTLNTFVRLKRTPGLFSLRNSRVHLHQPAQVLHIVHVHLTEQHSVWFKGAHKPN